MFVFLQTMDALSSFVKNVEKEKGKDGSGGDRTHDPRISLFYKYDALPTVLQNPYTFFF